ncbi:hypothetical protein A2480_02895 [Candidatus Uhrbacteria bacterium RIFOXYC2_FULL_47_19]|uniref:RNA-binding protein KhpA n=1 Tax=Candidatus Uhrbacteria bacterium RIFOXYC2_FULL_47_19 TaxID=1802424 RepID=A0A1F7WE34_9BACT|nr:MAG: hypothetical protein A2480_02895 [Candidatus Uhrbacteria bacterium RIFOXYC2_FULL_47_19]
MSEEFFDREFVEYVVKAIVNHPEDVRAERSIDERGVLITLYVNPEDMGYVIGKSGQTARSIRTLLKIVGAKNNARVNLKIYEPEGSRKFPSAAPVQSAPMPAVDEDEDIDTSAVDLKI